MENRLWNSPELLFGGLWEISGNFVSDQVAPEQFEQYQWRGRTIEYHRAQIRKLHGLRETTVDDAQALSHWLCEQVLPLERNAERLKSAVYDRCRELHLEPPTPERIDRVVRSAARIYEESFCAEILARLDRVKIKAAPAGHQRQITRSRRVGTARWFPLSLHSYAKRNQCETARFKPGKSRWRK